MRRFAPLVASLSLCSAAIGQSSSTPGDPFSNTPAESGFRLDGSYLNFHSSPSFGPTGQGDGRQGVGSIGGSHIVLGPRWFFSPSDRGYLGWAVTIEKNWFGDAIPSREVVGGEEAVTFSLWGEIDGGTSCWIPQVSSFNVKAALGPKGLPPGWYRVYCSGKGSHHTMPEASYQGVGWYCPELVKVKVKVVNTSGEPLAGRVVQPGINRAGGFTMPVWRAVTTGADGMATLVMPKIPCVLIGYGEALPYSDGEFTPSGPDWKSSEQPNKLVVMKLGQYPYPHLQSAVDYAAPPDPGGGTSNLTEGFFQSLFVPSTTTLDSWAARRDKVLTWGPIAFITGFWQTWVSVPRTLAIDADSSTAPVYVYSVSLDGGMTSSQSAFDLRPLATNNGVTTGSIYGSLLVPVRVAAGWVVWLLAVFGAWRWLRPKLTT